MTSVSSSRAAQAIPSATSTSHSLPVVHQRLRSSPRLRSSNAACVPNAPDWLMSATLPGASGTSSSALMNVPKSPIRGFITPMQLGPTMRRSVARATFSIRAWRRAPSAPLSANPELTTTQAPQPRSAAARTTSGASSAGTTTITRSAGEGRASREASGSAPCTGSAPGLIAWTGPGNPRSRR